MVEKWEENSQWETVPQELEESGVYQGKNHKVKKMERPIYKYWPSDLLAI